MISFKFKSLTMRIWATFAVAILLITLCLSIIYLYFFRYMDTKVKTQDLMDTHIYLLESNFDDSMRFDLFRNLRSASHFIYTNGFANDLGRPPVGGGRMPPPNMDSAMPQFDVFAVRERISDYAVGKVSEKSFYEKFDDIDFIFIITAMDEDRYFISYMPNVYDDSAMQYMLFISGLFILVGFVAARIIANYISKPLSKLENFSLKIAAKDWKEPIVLKNGDEIGRLAVSMNEMQEALKRADEDEKMFLQSISHDLKTPVMVIMSHADAILDGVYVDTLDKTAAVIKDEAIRLNKKIKQLLYLNTLDYLLGNQSEPSIMQIDETVVRIVNRFEVLGSNFEWHLNVEPAKISGNEEKMTVAIENILDNALRYAKSKIIVSVKQDKKFVRIEIFDDGNQIKPENLDKIFQSLYKDKTGNFGLGLAITKKIITFYGGSIYAENKENGVSFIINYPTSNA